MPSLPSRLKISAGFLAIYLVLPASAADYWGEEPFRMGMDTGLRPGLSDDTIRIEASAGMLFLEGDEYVYSGTSTLSHLIWQSKSPVLRGSIDVDVGNGFSIRAEGSVATAGTSYMEDYDWFFPTGNFDDWTHRSQHPDTSLDHYFTAGISAGYEVANTGDAKVRVHAGADYTDVKWSSRGGSFVYSEFGFRDSVGTFADGVPSIDYRQMIPKVFIGADGEQSYGNFRVGGLLRGGMTVLAKSTDDHWRRYLRIEDSFLVSPSVTAGLDIGYALGDNAELFVAGRYDYAFGMRGRAEYSDTRTGVITIAEDDIAGAALRSIEITGGLKGKF